MQRRLTCAVLRVQLISLVLLLCGGIGIGMALEAGIVPDFEGQYTLYGQHMLTVHYGLAGISCTPDHGMPEQCTRPIAQKLELSIRYISPTGVETWLALPLPAR
jgi:hypothetical protein